MKHVIIRVSALWVAVVFAAWGVAACGEPTPGSGGTPSPTASATAPRGSEDGGLGDLSFKDFEDELGKAGGPSNIVTTRNEQDGRFKFHSNIDLDRIKSNKV